MSNGKHRFSKGEPNNNLVVSGLCLRWAKENGYRSTAEELESMLKAYRRYQVEHGRSLSLMARPVEVLKAQAQRAREKLEQYEAALAGREVK